MRIIHLSDIHLVNNQKRTNQLVRRLCKSLESNCPIDFVFISGDLIDKGGNSFHNIKEAFDAFENFFIQPILDATGVDRSHIILVPGNHDLDVSKIKTDLEAKLKSNLSSSDTVYQFIVSEIEKNTDMGKYALSRLEAYNSYVDSFYKDVHDDNKYITSLAKHLKFNVDGYCIGISCLNSVWRCDEKGVGNPFILGKDQIIDSRDFMDDCNCKIAIIHNDPNSLADFECVRVLEYLHANYDCLFSGHKHIDQGQIVSNPQGDMVYFRSACMSIINTESPIYGNKYSVIDISLINGFSFTENIFYENDNREFEKQSSWKNTLSSKRFFKQLKDSLLLQKNHDSRFISCEKLDYIIEQIKDSKNETCLLLGLSGLGKTRLLIEAFKGDQSHNFYYCALSDDYNELENQLSIELNKNSNDTGLIILDNCTSNVFLKVVKYRDTYNTNFRIIGVSSSIHEFDYIRNYNKYIIKPEDLRDSVNNYIENEIPSAGIGVTAREQIKRFSEGFPMLAIQYVKSYKDNK